MTHDSHRRSSKHFSHFEICSSLNREVDDLIIQHGPEIIFDKNVEKGISTAVCNSNKKGFLLIDNSGIIRGVNQSGHLDVVQFLQLPINHLVFNRASRHFIGWLTNQTHIIIIGENLDILTIFYIEAPIVSILTSKTKPEFILIDTTDAISKWHFDSKAKIIKDHVVLIESGIGFNKEKIMLYNCVDFECFDRQLPELYAACGGQMLVINYYNGILISKHKLHQSEITAMVYLTFEKFMVTGSKDGKIKIWNSFWESVTEFLGHLNIIFKLIPCPYGDLLFSLSEDNTIKTWNLSTVNEIGSISLTCPATGIIADDRGQLLVYSEYHISLYTIQNLYSLMLSISYPLKAISTTHSSKLPIRLLLSSEKSIYVVSGVNGGILSKINLSKPNIFYVNLCLIFSEGLLLAMRDNGSEIIKMGIKEETGKLTRRWMFERDGVSCLGVYEYIVPAKTKSSRPTSPSERSSAIIPLLFVGFFSGKVSQLHLHTGQELYIILTAHKGQVSHMLCKPAFNAIVTAGKDRIIKVWQLLCGTKGPYLVPYIGFSAFDDIECIDSAEELVAVATTNREEREFRLTVYNYVCCTCKTHCLADDHLDSIINISSLESLKLFSTVGRDKTIRIWTHNNELLRIIQIDCIPTAVVFCNIRGDLAVGIRHHIFTIKNKKYLPKDFYRYVSSPIMFEESEPKVTTANQMLMKDIKAILSSEYVTPSQYDLLADTLQVMKQEDEQREKEEDEKREALSRLKKRTDEIYSIRDGKLFTSKKSLLDLDEKEEVFENYFDELWKKALEIPNLPLLTPPVKQEEPTITVKDQFPKVTRKKSFFPHPDEMEVDHLHPQLRQQLQLKLIPNSIIIKLLWPNETSWNAWKSWNKFHIVDTSKAELKPKSSSEIEDESFKSDVDVTSSSFNILTFHRPLEERMKDIDFHELILIRKGRLSARDPVELEIIRATTIDKRKTTLCLRDSPELYKLSDEERDMLKLEAGPDKIFTQIHILRGLVAQEVGKRAKKVIDLVATRTPYRRSRAKSPDQLRVKKLEPQIPNLKVPVEVKPTAVAKIQESSLKPPTPPPLPPPATAEQKGEGEVKFMAKLPDMIQILFRCCDTEVKEKEVLQELQKMGLVDPNNILLQEVKKWCIQEISSTDDSSLVTVPQTDDSDSCFDTRFDKITTEIQLPPCPEPKPQIIHEKSESVVERYRSKSTGDSTQSTGDTTQSTEYTTQSTEDTTQSTTGKGESLTNETVVESKTDAFKRRATFWFHRWTMKFMKHLLATVESLEKGKLKGCISSTMLKIIVSDRKGTLEEGMKPEDALNLAIPYQNLSDKALLENVNPIDILNYFCEMISDKKDRQKTKQPAVKSRLTPCDIYMKNDVGVQSAFAPWPAYLHMPLKKGEVILFRKSKDLPKPSLLTFQTSNKFFRPAMTAPYSSEKDESESLRKSINTSQLSESKMNLESESPTKSMNASEISESKLQVDPNNFLPDNE